MALNPLQAVVFATYSECNVEVRQVGWRECKRELLRVKSHLILN